MKKLIYPALMMMVLLIGNQALAGESIGHKTSFNANFNQILEESQASQKALHKEYMGLLDTKETSDEQQPEDVSSPAPPTQATRSIASVNAASPAAENN